MRPSGPTKAVRLAEPVNVIQVGDSVKFHGSPAVIGVTRHRGILNRTLLMRKVKKMVNIVIIIRKLVYPLLKWRCIFPQVSLPCLSFYHHK